MITIDITKAKKKFGKIKLDLQKRKSALEKIRCRFYEKHKKHEIDTTSIVC